MESDFLFKCIRNKYRKYRKKKKFESDTCDVREAKHEHIVPFGNSKTLSRFTCSLFAFTSSSTSINHLSDYHCWPDRPIGQEPTLCPDKALTREPWPKPLGQWGEAVLATTPAARATCCSDIMQLDTAIRMMKHTEFSTLTTPMAAADHGTQYWLQPLWNGRKMSLWNCIIVTIHTCVFYFSFIWRFKVSICYSLGLLRESKKPSSVQTESLIKVKSSKITLSARMRASLYFTSALIHQPFNTAFVHLSCLLQFLLVHSHCYV